MMKVTVPTVNGGVVHHFVVHGYQGSEEDPEKLSLTDKLLGTVLVLFLAWPRVLLLVGSWLLLWLIRLVRVRSLM